MSKNVVFMINIVQDQRSQDQGYEWSIKAWKHWCERWGHELFVLDQPIADLSYMAPQWYKIHILDILDSSGIDYEKVLYVDSDTMPHPGLPDIFNTVHTPNVFGAVHNYGNYDWVCRSIEAYSTHIFNGKVSFKSHIHPCDYFNSGVMIFTKHLKPMFDEIKQLYADNRDLIVDIQEQFGVGKDQPVLNYFINEYQKEKKLMYAQLPYEYNCQSMMTFELLDNFPHQFYFVFYGVIYHFNCGVKPNARYWLEATYKYLYEDKGVGSHTLYLPGSIASKKQWSQFADLKAKQSKSK